jgi:hypothetical protein
MRIKIIAVLFLVGIMSGFAVAQSSTSGSSSSSSTSSGPTGSTAGSTSSVTGSNTGAGSSSDSRSGIQIPSNSGNQNAPVQSVTPSTSLFNSQNLNSTSVFGSTLSGTTPLTGTPTMDQILSTQNDLISSTNSFLNPSTTSTNNRTQTSVLGQTIFGDTLMPGMTNIPIVTVVPSTTPTTFGTTSDIPNPQ